MSAVFGDVRRALNIWQRAAEVIEKNNKLEIACFHVYIGHALDEMIISLKIQAIKYCSHWKSISSVSLLRSYKNQSWRNNSYKHIYPIWGFMQNKW